MRVQDHLPFCHPRTTIQGAYGALDAVQHLLPATQIMAAAVLFKALVEELKLDVSDVLSQAGRIIKADETPYRTEVVALRGYIQGELNK